MLKAGIDFGIKSKNINLKTHYTYFGRTKTKVLSNKLESSIKTKNRKQFIDKKLTKSVDYNVKYVYHPLHIDQERTTLIETPFYTNQIEFIRNIVKSLPIDHVLYVKEHPTQSMRHWRSEEWYQEVMEIPNVTLIHPDISSQKLTKNCSLLITISGTAALEAAFLQKPSITFIDSDYTKIDSIERVKSIEELPKMIRKSIKKKITSEDLDRYVSLKENYAFDYNDEDFQQSSLNKFYHGGQLVDVDIMNEDMKEFLEESEKKLNEFTNQHIKKIEYLKKL
jgi:UDP-N-acetylglucosamine 2-epimerase